MREELPRGTCSSYSKRNWKLQFTITDAHDRIRKSAASPHAIGAGKRIYLIRLLYLSAVPKDKDYTGSLSVGQKYWRSDAAICMNCRKTGG